MLIEDDELIKDMYDVMHKLRKLRDAGEPFAGRALEAYEWLTEMIEDMLKEYRKTLLSNDFSNHSKYTNLMKEFVFTANAYAQWGKRTQKAEASK